MSWKRYTFWLSVEWADGAETAFSESAKYQSLSQAKRHAAEKCSESGCPVNVIDDHAMVRARYETVQDMPDETGHCEVRDVSVAA